METGQIIDVVKNHWVLGLDIVIAYQVGKMLYDMKKHPPVSLGRVLFNFTLVVGGAILSFPTLRDIILTGK